MNKQEAIKRLNAIDKEAKELRATIEAPANVIDDINNYGTIK